MTICVWPPVAEQPRIPLTEWRILKSTLREFHFLGVMPADGGRRLSTPIIAFDPRTQCGTTQSRHCYTVQGHTGANTHAELVVSQVDARSPAWFVAVVSLGELVDALRANDN